VKAWEIVGWTHDGAAYCAECKPHEDAEPIFASEEGWEDPVCDNPHGERKDGTPIFDTLGE